MSLKFERLASKQGDLGSRGIDNDGNDNKITADMSISQFRGATFPADGIDHATISTEEKPQPLQETSTILLSDKRFSVKTSPFLSFATVAKVIVTLWGGGQVPQRVYSLTASNNDSVAIQDTKYGKDQNTHEICTPSKSSENLVNLSIEEDAKSNASFNEEDSTGLEAVITVKDGSGEWHGCMAVVDTASATSCVSRSEVNNFGWKEKPIPSKDIRSYHGIGKGKVRPTTYVKFFLKCKELELSTIEIRLRVVEAEVGIILGMQLLEQHALLGKLDQLKKPGRYIYVLKDSRSKAQIAKDNEYHERSRSVALLLEERMGTYSSVPRRQYPANAGLLPNYGGQATHLQSSPATSYGPSNSIDSGAALPNSPFALTLQGTQTGAAPSRRYPSASPQQAQLPYRDTAADSMPQHQYYGTSTSSGREDAYYNPAVALRYGSLTRSSTTSSDSFETRSTAASSFTSYDADTVYPQPSRASSKYDQK